MKAISPRFKPLLRQLRELRRELAELKANPPPPPPHPLQVFADAMRPHDERECGESA
jgi:hypothetical protein